MKYCLNLSLIVVLALSSSGVAMAQGTGIYRCGNEYTNAKDAQKRGCKAVEGGNVTVIEGFRPNNAPATSGGGSGQGGGGAPAATAPSNAPRVAPNEQRARDSDARAILEAELRKAETRQAELLKEYNNGEPEKQGLEGKNYQKYLDRVAEMKANIDRNASDIAGIKRELGRVPASP